MAYLGRNKNDMRLRATGLITETFPVSGAPNSGLMATQGVYYGLVGLNAGDIITNINFAVNVQGTASTSFFVGLYDSAGNRLALSADLTTIADSTGMKTAALTAPYTITADGAYYLALLTISGTPPQIVRGNGTGGGMAAVGAGVRPESLQTGQTTLPTTATFGVSGLGMWMGAS